VVIGILRAEFYYRFRSMSTVMKRQTFGLNLIVLDCPRQGVPASIYIFTHEPAKRSTIPDNRQMWLRFPYLQCDLIRA